MTPLNNTLHANIKITKSNDVSRFKEQQLIPITAQDFIPLSTEFPIVFVKNEETGQFTSVAMMGIRPGVNLYCQGTDWPCHVKPLGFQNGPLSLVKTDMNSDQVMVCFDEKSPLINDVHGEALFDEKGNQTEFLNQKTDSLLRIAEYVEQTQEINEIFAKKKLLISKKLNVKISSEKDPVLLSGIYLIDDNALNTLQTNEFETLRNKGLLPLIYAHLTSLNQITRLTIKQNEFDTK
jgi:hypothetical protein